MKPVSIILFLPLFLVLTSCTGTPSTPMVNTTPTPNENITTAEATTSEEVTPTAVSSPINREWQAVGEPGLLASSSILRTHSELTVFRTIQGTYEEKKIQAPTGYVFFDALQLLPAEYLLMQRERDGALFTYHFPSAKITPFLRDDTNKQVIVSSREALFLYPDINLPDTFLMVIAQEELEEDGGEEGPSFGRYVPRTLLIYNRKNDTLTLAPDPKLLSTIIKALNEDELYTQERDFLYDSTYQRIISYAASYSYGIHPRGDYMPDSLPIVEHNYGTGSTRVLISQGENNYAAFIRITNSFDIIAFDSLMDNQGELSLQRLHTIDTSLPQLTVRSYAAPLDKTWEVDNGYIYQTFFDPYKGLVMTTILPYGENHPQLSLFQLKDKQALSYTPVTLGEEIPSLKLYESFSFLMSMTYHEGHLYYTPVAGTKLKKIPLSYE